MDKFSRSGGAGEKLHQALVEYDNREDTVSWLDEFWPQRYLGRRDPIALNANFFFLFKDKEENQVERSAGIISTSLAYKLLLDQNRIPPAMMRDTPLCMNEVRWLFSATRIPGHGRDRLSSFYSNEMPGPSTARHILIFHKNQMYRMDVVSADGKPHSYEDIKAGISHILETGQDAKPNTSVGHLTTLPRAEWADTRNDLMMVGPENKALLDVVETALFSISLEDHTPETPLAACDQLLHGNSGNRWFDKAIQMMIFEDGRAGINIEHCGLDGTAILSFVDAISDMDAQTVLNENGASSQGQPNVQPLEFTLTRSLKSQIGKAAKNFSKMAQNASTSVFDFEQFGAAHIKTLKMSPDAFVQTAMQRAHDRVKGFTGATYESIATRHFEHGRTEAMRTVTPELIEFLASMRDNQASNESKISKFRETANAHVGRAKDCQQGKAPEQHLWELLNIYHRSGKELGINKGGVLGSLVGNKNPVESDVLNLFKSPGWNKMRDDSLSTSSAPSQNVTYFGFGSTGPGCFGVGYIVKKDDIRCYMCTSTSQSGEMQKFISAFEEALLELSALLAEDTQS